LSGESAGAERAARRHLAADRSQPGTGEKRLIQGLDARLDLGYVLSKGELSTSTRLYDALKDLGKA
jgi:hypothetical protein